MVFGSFWISERNLRLLSFIGSFSFQGILFNQFTPIKISTSVENNFGAPIQIRGRISSLLMANCKYANTSISGNCLISQLAFKGGDGNIHLVRTGGH